MNYINLNGKITTPEEARMPIDNGSFRYGYGLFETMLVQDGAINLMQYHWDRLFAGMRQLYFELPVLFTEKYLEAEVLKTVQKNKPDALCRVRLQVFATGGGLYSSEKNSPGFLIECFPLDPSLLLLNENGLTLGVAKALYKSVDSLSNLKSCNALVYAIAAKQAKENKWNDGLICNTAGNIIESTIANLFWIKNGQVYTPPLSEGCIAGVMRRYITDKIPVTEKTLSLQQLSDANEVFLTNSVRRIKWVQTINNIKYTNKDIKKIYTHLF